MHVGHASTASWRWGVGGRVVDCDHLVQVVVYLEVRETD